MKYLLLTCLMLSISIVASAQDIIVKKGSEEIKCKVSEVGQAEIKYHKWENIQGPVYSIKKSDVLKIKFENGTEEVIQQEEFSVISDRDRRVMKRAITTRPFSPIRGHLCLGYQQAISNNKAMVFELGLIGPRIGTMAPKANGGYFRAGFRLKKSPEFVTQDMEWGFNLGGAYVQPEIAYSAFSRDESVYNSSTGTYTTERQNSQSGAFLITVGKQVILGDIMTFDLSGSIGYAVSRTESSSNGVFEGFPRSYYSHGAGDSDFPLAWNVTLSMGFLMK